MKTYLSVWFNSSGARPSEVSRTLGKLGFKPVKGNYDFAYDWSHSANVDEILSVGDKIQQALKDKELVFKLETM